VKAHLLRVTGDAAPFAPLFAAARAAGLRVGWLELAALAAPPSLESAAAQGALRAVAVSAGRSVSVKPRRGAPVLHDLLREHFAGCALVLVRSDEWSLPGEAPPLLKVSAAETAAAWEIAFAAGSARRYTSEELVATLRRPRPWDS
jgi:hypothetical protein